MNKISGSCTVDKEAARREATHPFAEQDKLASRAAANQVATFWKSRQSATEKKSAPPIRRD